MHMHFISSTSVLICMGCMSVTSHMHSHGSVGVLYVGVGGISVYLVNFGFYWIPTIIGWLNRDTEIPILFGFTWYELHF